MIWKMYVCVMGTSNPGPNFWCWPQSREGNKKKELSAAPGICPNHLAHVQYPVPSHRASSQNEMSAPDKGSLLPLTSVEEGCLNFAEPVLSIRSHILGSKAHVCPMSGPAVREGREWKPRPSFGELRTEMETKLLILKYCQPRRLHPRRKRKNKKEFLSWGNS